MILSSKSWSLFFLILVTLVGFAVFAAPKDPEPPAPGDGVSPECSSYLRRFDFSASANGVGHRGFFGFAPEATIESVAAAAELGIKEWGLRIWVMPSTEAAQAHDAGMKVDMDRGAYLISTDWEGPKSDQEVPAVLAPLFFEQASKTGLVWFLNGTPQEVAAERITSLFRLENLMVINFGPWGIGFAFRGWALPPKRGVMIYEHMVQGGSRAKNNRRLLRRADELESLGYRFAVNQGFEAALTLLRNQVRTKLVDDPDTGEKKRVVVADSANRFNKESEVALNRALHAAGVVSSFELWSPEERLLAGALVHRRGNLVYDDTIFYDVTVDGVGVDMAKMVELRMMRALAAEGIPFVDLLMLSRSSIDFGAEEISREDFIRMVAALPPVK